MSSSRTEEKAIVDWDKPIASGSTSAVFKALQGKEVFAVKSVTPLKRYNFLDEQAMLRRLNALSAPNTIKYFEDLPVKLSDYHPYVLAMEWMPTSLHDVLSQQEEWDWTDRYKIMTEAMNGLAFYHAHNILHRDIKSYNLLVSADDLQVKFCDFALSKELTPGALCYEAGCSPPWAPPEYIRNVGVGLPGDIYSYATMCWEIATWGGETPFAKMPGVKTSLDIAAKVVAGERNPIPKDCPNKIAKLITWGWGDDPAKRPTAQAFLEELGGGLDEISEKLKEVKP